MHAVICQGCGYRVEFSLFVPEVCSRCGESGQWRSAVPPFVLTFNDRKLLKALGIDPDG